MQSNSLRKEVPVIRKLENQPYVSMHVAFDPTMTSKFILENRLKTLVENIKSELYEHYSFVAAKDVSDKLTNIIKSLDYNTHKKSAIILVSSDDQKVFYRNESASNKYFISNSFEYRNIVELRKNDQDYLILSLSRNNAAIYRGKGETISRILLNVFDPSTFNDPGIDTILSEKKVITQTWRSCMRSIDKNLAIVLDAFSFPVFVVGSRSLINHFEQVTINDAFIAKFIESEFIDSSEDEIEKLIEPHLKNWQHIKEIQCKKLLDAAMDNGKLAVGIQEVWDLAKKKNIKHLILEKDFSYHAYLGKGLIVCAEEATNNSFIKDAVDEILENVLADGGLIDFVSENSLKDYLHIAAIRTY